MQLIIKTYTEHKTLMRYFTFILILNFQNPVHFTQKSTSQFGLATCGQQPHVTSSDNHIGEGRNKYLVKWVVVLVGGCRSSLLFSQ